MRSGADRSLPRLLLCLLYQSHEGRKVRVASIDPPDSSHPATNPSLPLSPPLSQCHRSLAFFGEKKKKARRRATRYQRIWLQLHALPTFGRKVEGGQPAWFGIVHPVQSAPFLRHCCTPMSFACNAARANVHHSEHTSLRVNIATCNCISSASLPPRPLRLRPCARSCVRSCAACGENNMSTSKCQFSHCLFLSPQSPLAAAYA